MYIAKLKKAPNQQFKMFNLKPYSFYLNIYLKQNKAYKKLLLSQVAYINKVLAQYKMQNYTLTNTFIATTFALYKLNFS